jgi:hypothetical protein
MSFMSIDVLLPLLGLGYVTKGVPPWCIKEHHMSENYDPNKQFIIYRAILEGENEKSGKIDVAVYLSWLDRYVGLTYDAFKEWMQAKYPNETFTSLEVTYYVKGSDETVMYVDLTEDKWLIKGVTEETDVAFGIFPLFTEQ